MPAAQGNFRFAPFAYSHDLEIDGFTPVLAQFLVNHILDNISQVKKKKTIWGPVKIFGAILFEERTSKEERRFGSRLQKRTTS